MDVVATRYGRLRNMLNINCHGLKFYSDLALYDLEHVVCVYVIVHAILPADASSVN